MFIVLFEKPIFNMRLNKLVLLFFPLLIGYTTIYGQKIFREGYIIKSNGDSLKGIIQFEEGQKISQKCVFKRFDIAITVEYTPENLKAFGYNHGNFYETKVVEGKKIFVECLVKGDISLYLFGKKFYLEEKNIPLVELKSGSIKGQKDSKDFEFANAIDYLVEITRSAPGISIPANLQLVDKQLIPIVRDYNQRVKVNYIVYNRHYNTNLFEEAIMLTGVNMISYGLVNAIYIRSSALSYGTDYHFSRVSDMGLDNKNWAIGVYRNTRISRLDKRLSVHTELVFLRQKQFFYQVLSRTYPNETQRIKVYSNLTVLKLPVMFQFTLSVKKAKFYGNLGAVLNYNFLNNKEGSMLTENATNQVYSYVAKNFNRRTSSFSLGANAGVGVKYKLPGNKEIFFETRVEFGGGVNQTLKFDYYYAPKITIQQMSPQFIFLIGVGI
jgi:hypothetical protein